MERRRSGADSLYEKRFMTQTTVDARDEISRASSQLPINAKTSSDGVPRLSLIPELGNVGRDADVVATCVADAAARLTRPGRPPQLNALGPGTRSLAVQAALSPAVEAIVAGTRDQGDDVSAVLARSLDAYAQATTMRAWLFERMAGEPLINKGNARAMLGAYLSLLDRELRLAQVIGMARKSRKVGTVAELLS